MKIYGDSPNFSIVLPGPCNANCPFCFWKEKPVSDTYLEDLKATLKDLPPEFNQVSLTGGEPTFSPYFAQVFNLAMVYFTKIIVTTNGVNLVNVMDSIYTKENVEVHFNISRHHHDDAENRTCFQTDTVPGSDEIEELIDQLNRKGIDVNMNTVLTQNLSTKVEMDEMIKWARSIGFTSISFRKQHGDLDPSEQELMYSEYETVYENSCPVCYSKQQFIKGIPVYWKSSVEEPGDALSDYVYELIYHPDNILSSDWEGEKEVIYYDEKFYTQDAFIKLAKKLLGTGRLIDEEGSVPTYSSSGCHRGGCH